MRPVLIAVLGLLVLIGSVLLFLRPAASPSEVAPVSLSPTHSASTADLEDGSSSLDAGEPGEAAQRSQASDAGNSAAGGTGETTLVSGKVRWPDERRDPAARVYLVDGPRDYPDFAQELETRQDQHAAPLSVPIGEDDTFEVRIPIDMAKPHFMLRGRYGFTPRSVAARTGKAPVLRPDWGVWIHGRVSTAEGDVVDSRLILHFDMLEFTPTALSGKATNLETVVDEQGEYSLDAMPAPRTYDLGVRAEGYAAQEHAIGQVLPGQDLEVDYVLGPGAILRGRVVNAEGSPVPKAEVNTRLAGRFFGFDDREVAGTETDASGRFELTHVPVGSVQLLAEAVGYLESSKQKLELSEGEIREGLVIELGEGQSIAGRLIWQDGSPAENIELQANFDVAFMAGPSGMGALRGAKGRTRSDAQGHFEIRGLGSGPFIVSASAPPRGQAQAEESEQWKARRDAVQPGSAELALVLHPPIGLRGQVRTPEETPLAEFEISAHRVSEGSMGPVGMTVRSQSFDDPQGHFLFTDMVPGTWHLYARAPGWGNPDPVVIELAGGDGTTEIPVIATAAVYGSVRGFDGEPVEGATVVVDDGQPDWQSAMAPRPAPPETISNEDGSFELRDVFPGEVGLVAEAENYCASPAVPVTLESGGELRDVQLILSEGGGIEGLVYNAAGDPARGRMVTLNHMATFQTQTAVSDAAGSFEFRNLMPGSWQIMAMDSTADWSQSSSGDLSGMLDSMQLAQAEVIAGEIAEVVIGAPPADPIELFGTVTQDGEPYRGAMVSFYPSGEKLYERLRFASVDKDGNYGLTVDGPGDYVVYVQLMPGGVAEQQTIEYSREVPSGVSEHRIDLKIPLGRISGKVTGPDGEPAGSTRVTLSVAGGSRSDQLFGGQYTEMSTEPDGSYDLTGLRPGDYQLSVGGEMLLSEGGAKYARQTRTGLRVGKDEWLQNVDFELGPPGEIDVTVRNAAGQPVAGAFLFIRDAQGSISEPFSLKASDGAGRIRAAGLAPGNYTLVARQGALASVESPPVRVVAGERVEAELKVEDGVVLWILLTSKKEKEDLRASVWVRDSEGREMTGMFSIEDLQNLYMKSGFSPTEHRVGPLPPGRYRVEARTPDGLSASKPVTLRAGDLERKLRLRLD